MKKITIILSLLAILASCTRHEPDNSGQDGGERRIMLKAMTKAGITVSDAEQTPVFLFWFEDGKNNFGTGDAKPYIISRPKGQTDEYKTTPYNTGYPYPGTLTLYANGYCPSLLEVNDNDFTTLSIPESLLGRLDVTATTGFLEGSATNRFDDKTLVFNHLQSKVNFYARLGEIPAERYFRAVKITVNGKNLFTDKVAWDSTNTAWEASTTVSYDKYWAASDPNINQMDPNEVEPRSIGSVYIHPGQTQIVFDVEVEMSETVTFDSSETIKTTATVEFENGSTGITLNAGDEYDINITILYDSFVIKGNKALWQEGGKIPLPFYPN